MISSALNEFKTVASPRLTYGGAIAISYVAKLWLATLGNNYDLFSYQIVADAVWNHEIIYSATYRYNYGPVWAYVLAGLQWIQQTISVNSGLIGLHVAITMLLASCDVAIGGWLRRTYSEKMAIAFLLNPIVWLISGFHAQFDNLAIYLAIISWSILRTEELTPKNALRVGGWLGLSLMTKHLMLFFLIWIWFDRRLPIVYRLLVVGVAGSLFVSSFLPFLLWDFRCWHDIWEHVVAYRSGADYSIIGHSIRLLIGPSYQHLIFFMALSGIGYWLSRRSDYFFLYLIALVACSTAMADQYLVIPAIACAYFGRSRWLKYYILVVLFSLLTRSVNNLSTLLPIKPILDSWLDWQSPILDTIIRYGIAQIVLLYFVGRHLYRILRLSLLNFSWFRPVDSWIVRVWQQAHRVHSLVHL